MTLARQHIYSKSVIGEEIVDCGMSDFPKFSYVKSVLQETNLFTSSLKFSCSLWTFSKAALLSLFCPIIDCTNVFRRSRNDRSGEN